MVSRQDVEARVSQHLVGMIECHPESRSRPAIVAGDEELPKAEMLHDLQLIERHAAERIVAVILASARFAAVTVAAKVSRDHREVLCKPGRNEMPVDMCEWIAVHQ
jgi:hypothetical protein